MPEPMGRRTSTSPAEMSGGFFFGRVVSPGAAAAEPPWRRRRRELMLARKESVDLSKSPLPVSYPPSPFQDITIIVRALEARRARRAQQMIDAETSAEILASVDPTCQREGVPATGGLPSEPSTPSPAHYELQASSPARQTPVTTTEASPAVPQRAPETHQMLCSKLDEKDVKAYMKKAPKQPSKMITTARHTPVTTTVPQRTPVTHQMLCSKLDEIEKHVKAYMKRAPKQPSMMNTRRRTLMSMR